MMNLCLALLLILTSTRLSSARLNSFDDKDIHQKENESEQQSSFRVRHCPIDDINSGWGLLTPHNIHVHEPATPGLSGHGPATPGLSGHGPATPDLSTDGVTLDSGSQIVTRSKKQKSLRFGY